MSVDVSRTPSLDLSEVTKLKYVIFSCDGSDVQWITATVITPESKNLQQVAIHLYADFPAHIREAVCREWEDFDRLLVELWTSSSVRPKIMYQTGKREDDIGDTVPRLLQELRRRGVVECVDDWKDDDMMITTAEERVRVF